MLNKVEKFIVKHYASDDRPTIKGNGFDGLEVGTEREEAEELVAWINDRIRVDVREIDILFDGPPSHESGRFIEVEDTATRKSVSVGEWVKRDDGCWVLRLVIASSSESPGEGPSVSPDRQSKS